MPAIKVLQVNYDTDTESPMEWDGSWKLVSFSNSRTTDEPGERYVKSYGRDGVVPANIGLRRKLDVGLAFWLACYQHGNEVWSLRNEGPQCQWDTCNLAGILLWPHKPGDMGAKTLEDRAKDARSFLQTYNSWLNGDCYWYSLETLEGEHIDSCGGFIGLDHFTESVNEVLDEGDVVVSDGDDAWHWLTNHQRGKRIETVEGKDDLRPFAVGLLTGAGFDVDEDTINGIHCDYLEERLNHGDLANYLRKEVCVEA